jgi:hypothetical protein
MAGEVVTSPEIKDTDIVFDCPHCGKSLAIDYRGAGLSVPCTDCGKYVPVPIPEGMELDDIDSTEEEQEVRILNLRRSLAAAHFRIRELEGEIIELRERRVSLEKDRADRMMRMGAILGKVGIVRDAVRRLNEALEQISGEQNGEKTNG